MGRNVGENDGSEIVGHRSQLIPGCEISGRKDCVRAGWPGYSKLKGSNRLYYPDKLDRYGIGEHIHSLSLQTGDRFAEIDGGWFRQNEGGQRIAKKSQRLQLRHVRRQCQRGKQISRDEQSGQVGQPGWQFEVYELVSAEVQRLQMSQIRRQNEIGQLIATKGQERQICQPWREGQTGEFVAR